VYAQLIAQMVPLYNPTTHSGYQPTTDVTIENLDVENMYVKTQYTDHTDDANDDNHAIQYAGSNLTVAYNTAHDAGFALFGTADSSDSSSSGDSNVNVYGNDIYNVDHGFAIGDSDTSGATITDDSIHNNYIHDYANWDTPGKPPQTTLLITTMMAYIVMPVAPHLPIMAYTYITIILTVMGVG
jgi:hypothetical protein